MQSSVYQNGPSYLALSKKDIKDARAKFGDLTPIDLEWPVTPIPQVLETQAAGLILQQETFRRLKRKQVNHIDELLQMLPITTNMTINLRKQLLRMSLLVNTHRVRRDRDTICKEYDSGRSLIELSTVHNYPRCRSCESFFVRRARARSRSRYGSYSTMEFFEGGFSFL